MANEIAEWTVELNVSCPKCHHLFDVTCEQDFWEYSGIKRAGQCKEDHETACPECGHEFKCDFVY